MSFDREHRISTMSLFGLAALCLLLSGCATPPPRIEMVQIPLSPPAKEHNSDLPGPQQRLPAYVRIEISAGGYKYYPTPDRGASVALFLSPEQQTDLWITPYLQPPLKCLERTGIFASITDVTEQEKVSRQAEKGVDIVFKVDSNVEKHLGRLFLRHVPITALLFYYAVPLRTEYTLTLRVEATRYGAQPRVYQAAAVGAIYYHQNAHAARSNLMAHVMSKSFAAIEDQMRGDAMFFRKDAQQNKPVEDICR